MGDRPYTNISREVDALVQNYLHHVSEIQRGTLIFEGWLHVDTYIRGGSHEKEVRVGRGGRVCGPGDSEGRRLYG